jgi:hypothetical protein
MIAERGKVDGEPVGLGPSMQQQPKDWRVAACGSCMKSLMDTARRFVRIATL